MLKDCNKNKPTIILSHYSPNSFDPMEQKAVLKILKDHSVQLWFAGHKHTDIIYKDFEYVYVAHSGNQTFERLTSPGFVEGILDTEFGQGIFRVHRWNESAGWAVYPTLVDNAVCKGEDETKYPFILDAWLKATGKKLANKNNINFRVRNYLKNYKGSTLLTQELATDLGLEEQCVIEILEEFQQKGFVKVLNYKKSQWEILCHPACV